MEIKEAVGILKGLQEPEAWESQITEKTFEALDIAIRALVNANGTPLIYEKRMTITTITESDLVKMGVIDPTKIKPGVINYKLLRKGET